ncbi:MAG: hypothetical protein IJP90_10060 [Treponema sp.]|nr:hypothetical protein [Treponema sp.]
MLIFLVLIVIVVLVCIGSGRGGSSSAHKYRSSDYGNGYDSLGDAGLGEGLNKADMELLIEDDDIREEFRDEVDYDFYDEVDETIYDDDIRDEFGEF